MFNLPRLRGDSNPSSICLTTLGSEFSVMTLSLSSKPESIVLLDTFEVPDPIRSEAFDTPPKLSCEPIAFRFLRRDPVLLLTRVWFESFFSAGFEVGAAPTMWTLFWLAPHPIVVVFVFVLFVLFADGWHFVAWWFILSKSSVFFSKIYFFYLSKIAGSFLIY